MLLRLSVLAASFIALASASNVVELSPDNFDSVVGNGKPALVEFFAPWCGHCKSLAPVYEQLADAYTHAKDKVVIAKVDADGIGKSLGQKYGVKGYPTLKWFDAQGGEPEDYEGGRDLDALANFVTQKSGVKSNIKPPPPGATRILDVYTFDDVVLDKSNDVLVAFTAPWCGHCKHLKPIYEKVARTFLPESKCIVANVDADAEVNAPLAQKYKISSFPTIVFFPKDNKEGEQYEGGRSEEDFVEFLNEKCGTQRAVGGGLNEKAGRISDFDELAVEFFSAAANARQAIVGKATKLSTTFGENAQSYLKVMNKIVKGSDDYLEKEKARLRSILLKRTMSEQKLDELTVKLNVLSAFSESDSSEEPEEYSIKREEL